MFWRREGGPLDIKNNSPMAWLLRIIAVVLIAAVVVMMFRLAAPRAAADHAHYRRGGNARAGNAGQRLLVVGRR